jgi:hypothetical protein
MVGARLSPEERREIDRVARAADRTMSREIRRAVRFYLGNVDSADRYLRRVEDEEGAV